MRNRVYFGSYTLEHWLKLLRTRDIILPEYQRHFVWEKSRMSKLADAIKNDLFIPPITIGSFNNNGKTENLIIDGQQRLTSILLAYLGLFPQKEHYHRNDEKMLAKEDAGLEDDEQDDDGPVILKWNVNELLDGDNSFAAIKERAKANGCYDEFVPLLDTETIKNRFLGFNYLVPDSNQPGQMQKYFSSVFRSVNYSGVNLLPQESRKALYYLDANFEEFFAPHFCEKITVDSKRAKGSVIMDFTRAISLLAVYHKTLLYEKVGRGYGRRLEQFYELFIQWVVSDENQDIFGMFDELYPQKDYHKSLLLLQETIESLKFAGKYESIIELDVYFMGLIYIIMYKKQKIRTDNCDLLRGRLQQAINSFKEDPKHKRSPASLKYMQERMKQSIEIYSAYVQE